MNAVLYKKLIKEAPIGYAYHKILCNSENVPFDYEFLEVNAAFENLTGLKASKIIGKRVTEVLPDIKESSFNWISFYGEIALNGGSREIEQFSESLQQWYRVKVFSPEKYFFITYINDVSKEMIQISDMQKISDISEQFLQTIDSDLDYQRFTDDILSISGAKYAAFNLYDDDGMHYKTMALAGDLKLVNKAINMLGFKIDKKKWEHDLKRADRIKNSTITVFQTLTDLTGDVLPAQLVSAIETIFNIGNIVLIKIMKNNLMLGDFTIFMQKNKSFNNYRTTEIYATQLGQIIARKRAEQTLKESEEKFRQLFDNMMNGFSLFESVYDKQQNISDYRIIIINESFCNIVEQKLSDIKEKCLSDVLPLLKENWIKAFNSVLATGLPVQFEEYSEYLKKYLYLSAYTPKKNQIAMIIIDITDKRKIEAENKFLSYHDQLTGLFNRRYFENTIQLFDDEKSNPLTILMADVNGLKLTNDAFGHKTGDMLLEKIACLLKRECRAGDIISRIGGDEFVILLPNTDLKNANKIVHRINNAIANEKMDNVILSISIGIAVKQHITDDINDLLKQAEDDMYRHKLSESMNMRNRTLKLIMEKLYEKDSKEIRHSNRVSEICESIAEKMNFSKEDIYRIKTAGLMHDIGNIAIDNNIFQKTKKLNYDEWNEIERHSEIGYRILTAVSGYSNIADIVLEHHERWDGKGYPKGIGGEEIKLHSRIIAIADAYDAMTSYRPYKKILSEEEAISEIKACSGKQFDPDIAEIFIEKVLNNLPDPILSNPI